MYTQTNTQTYLHTYSHISSEQAEVAVTREQFYVRCNLRQHAHATRCSPRSDSATLGTFLHFHKHAYYICHKKL